MTHTNHSPKVLAAVFFSLVCALCAPAHSAEFSQYFDSSSQGSMADLVRGLRSHGDRSPDPKAPTAEPSQPGNTGGNELLHFWEDLKEDVFDDICKDIEIPIEQGFDLDGVGGIEGKFKRYMKQYPDNKIAVIDEVGVKVNAGHTFTDIFSVADNPFNIGFSAGLEGKSVVVRKTNEDKYCKNLLNLADLRKVKTILPINEKRIGAMGVNEIWKFPVRIHMGVSGGIGYPVQPWLSVGFSLGTSKEAKPSVTLFRMSEDKLRVRLRLDRITVKHVGASAGTSFDAGMLGLPEAEGFLMKELNKTLVKEFNKYMALKFGLSHSRAKGKKLLLEFIVDPKNPAQVAKLVDFLKGDLGIIRKLIEMGVRFNDFSDADDNAAGAQAMQAVNDVAAEGLGLNSTFAGANHFNATSNGSNIMLPILLHREASTGQRYDRYQTTNSDQVLHVHNASKNESVSNINVPILGKIFKHNTNQNFYVVNYEDRDGRISDAAVVYQRYEGYIKHDERDARGMVANMNEILKYAGTQGSGVNNDFMVNVDALFPRLDPANATDTDEWGDPVYDTKRYKSAIMSFSLVFTQQAVSSILLADSNTILKAVLNVMEGLDREILQKISHLFKFGSDNKVDYDWKAARKLLASYETDQFDPFTVVRSFCLNVTNIVADVASVRNEGDPKAKSKRLAEVLGGKGRSRVGYENMMQVLIQLVSVKDIYAKLDLNTDKRIKGEENISNSYNMYNSNLQAGYGEQLNAANALRDRFADPSVLSD